MIRVGPPSMEIASTSGRTMPTSYSRGLCGKAEDFRRTPALQSGRPVNIVAQAAAKHQAQRRKADGPNIGQGRSDTARPEVKAQVMAVMSSTDLPAYIPLSEAQEVISEAVEDANSALPTTSGQQVHLRNRYECNQSTFRTFLLRLTVGSLGRGELDMRFHVPCTYLDTIS